MAEMMLHAHQQAHVIQQCAHVQHPHEKKWVAKHILLNLAANIVNKDKRIKDVRGSGMGTELKIMD